MHGLIQGYKQCIENSVFSALEFAFLSFEFPPSPGLLSSPRCSIKVLPSDHSAKVVGLALTGSDYL